jgi:hypothetical protein
VGKKDDLVARNALTDLVQEVKQLRGEKRVLENAYIEQGAILEAVESTLKGEEVSDFMGSFSIVDLAWQTRYFKNQSEARTEKAEATLITAQTRIEELEGRKIKLCYYTTDDGRITDIAEMDDDGDPCDTVIVADSLIEHIERLVTRSEQAEAERDTALARIQELETERDEMTKLELERIGKKGVR